jgi:hypothetical protein
MIKNACGADSLLTTLRLKKKKKKRNDVTVGGSVLYFPDSDFLSKNSFFF